MSDDLEPLSTDPNDFLFADVETRSSEDVTVHGAYRHNAAGRVTIVAYAIGDGPMQDWVLTDWSKKLDWREAPADLAAAVERVKRGEMWFVAHNAGFEFNAFTRGMVGLEDFRVEWMIDSMVQAARSHLPADLAGAAKAIGLTQKQTAGKALIKMFADASRPETPASHPAEWDQFRSYARDDVAAMRDVFFATMPLTRREWREYWAVEAINHRGVPVDVEFVRQAVGLSEKLTETSNADIARLTKGKVRTVNQSAALLDWLRYTLRALPEVDRILTREIDLETDEDGEEHAVAKMSLGRSHVEELIAYLGRVDAETGLTDDEFDALQVLEVRLYGASATPKKYRKLIDVVDGDGRLKGSYVFNGAAATGRLSGRAVQPQNLTRSKIGGLKDEAEAIEMIAERGGACFDDLRERWGPVGRTLSRLIRPAFVAPEGKTMLWADWSAIEARILPWLAASEGGEEVLDVFRTNDADKRLPDIYKVTAAKILGKSPYDVTKQERQSHGKVPCIAEGQLVLTDRGEVPIERVTLDMRVWDGVSWVSHQGLVYKGVKDVWEYDGVVATADHIVWTETCGQMRLLDAARRGERIVQSGSGGTPIRLGCGDERGETLHATWVSGGLRSDALHGLRCGGVGKLVEPVARQDARLPDLLAASADTKMAGPTAPLCTGALHEPERCQLAQLRGAGYRVPLSRHNGCRAVDCRELGFGQGARDRPYRHERSLRAGEPALGYAEAAELEQARKHPGGVDLPRGGLAVRLQHREAEVAGGLDARADHRAGARGGSHEAQKVARYCGKARVYDLVNAGPRHRFTVSGKLVHNCLALGFGGGKGALFAMARAYGASFTEDEAQTIVDDWRNTNPWAAKLWHQIWEAVLWCMDNPGEPRMAGRMTYLFDSGYLGGTLFGVLPCGRPLLYPGLRWADVEQKDKKTGEIKTRKSLTVRQARARVPLSFLTLTNNGVQGTAASLLRDALVRIGNEPLLETVLTTHDEVICLVDAGRLDAAREALMRIMLTAPPWAEGLPIAAEATTNDWYSKAVEG
jgi:DNA polymerase bacteriophage-type